MTSRSQITQSARKGFLLILLYVLHIVSFQLLVAYTPHLHGSQKYYTRQQQEHKKKPFSQFITNHVPSKQDGGNCETIAITAICGEGALAVTRPVYQYNTQHYALRRTDEAYKRYLLVRSVLI